MKNIQSFNTIYNHINSSIFPKLNVAWLEAKKESHRNLIIVLLLCAIIDIPIFYFIFSNPYLGISHNNSSLTLFNIAYTTILLLMLDLFIGLFIFSLFWKKNKKYKVLFKTLIINELINNFYDDLKYYPNYKISSRIYDEANYNRYYNRYYSDDYLTAKLNNTYPIQMGEVTVQKVTHHRSSNGSSHTSTTTWFSGLFAKIEIPKSINSNLQIASNGNLASTKYKLELDSSEFEKLFDVSATNNIIGMQLLTSDVMEKLIDFRKKNDMKYDITILNNNIYLRFNCGKMFESGYQNNGELDEAVLKKYYNILNFTYDLSTHLIELIDLTEI